MSLPLLGAGMATDGPSAVLDLNFASLLSLTPSVGPTPSYTRASTGTYFNSSGVLTTAAINGPRFDHVYNGSSWVSKGLLVEEARTNSLIRSEQFDDAAWFKFNSPISANFAIAPDGASTADKCIPNTVNNAHALYNSSPISISSGVSYTASVYAKASGYNFVFVANDTIISSTLAGVCVNLADGSQSNAGGAGAYTVVDVGNGWWRISSTVTSASTNGYIEIFPRASAGTNTSFIGNGTDGVLIWGAQLESGAFPTSYIPTTAAAVTRSADVCQITGGDFSGFYNQSEGSFAVAYDCPAVGSLVQYQANSAPATNLHNAVSIGTTQYFQVYLPPQEALINAGSIAANVSQSLSSAYKINDFAASLNGGAVAIDTAGSLPTPTKLIIGSDGSSYINGHIARLRYFNTRLINSQLVALST